MTKSRLIVTGIMLVLAVTLANAWIGYKGYTRGCSRDKTLAKIEHALISGQQASTKALIREGITFNIPKQRLDEAVKRGEAEASIFLSQLDSLAHSNCSIF